MIDHRAMSRSELRHAVLARREAGRASRDEYRLRRLVGELNSALAQHRLFPLTGRLVLEVGCGSGYWLHLLESLGSRPNDLHGIDISSERIGWAAASMPGISFSVGDAVRMPYRDAQFDLALQFTMFTSMLDNDARRSAAAELIRVLKPGGMVFWYDFIWNPINRNTRGIGERELRSLFPRCRFDIRRVTLLPPLARWVAPFSIGVCRMLERVPQLRSHYLAVISKPTISEAG